MGSYQKKYTMLLYEKLIMERYLAAIEQRKKKYRNWKRVSSETGAIISAIIALILDVWGMLDYQNHKDLIRWSLVIFLLMLLLRRLAVYYDYKMMAQDSQYQLLGVTRNFLSSSDRRPLLIAYVAKEIDDLVRTLTLEERTYLANTFTKRAEETKKNGWFILSMLGVFLFSVWGAYLQAAIGIETDLNHMLGSTIAHMILSIVVVFFIVCYRFGLDQTILKKSTDYQVLAEIVDDF